MLIGKEGKNAKRYYEEQGVTLKLLHDLVQLKGDEEKVNEVYREIKWRVDGFCSINLATVPKVAEGIFRLTETSFMVEMKESDQAMVIDRVGQTNKELNNKFNIYVSKTNNDGDFINLNGDLDGVKKAQKWLMELHRESQAATSSLMGDTKGGLRQVGFDIYEFELKAPLHELIAGKSGMKLKELNTKFGVQIQLSKRQEDEGEEGLIIGDLDDVKDAYLEIRNILVKARSDAPIKTPGLERISPGVFKYQFDEHYIGFLLGTGGERLRALEKEYLVAIDIPRKGYQGYITMKGELEDVDDLAEEISKLIDSKRNAPSHWRTREKVAATTTSFKEEIVAEGLRKTGPRIFKMDLLKEDRTKIIGVGGKTIKHLRDKYQVRIVLPDRDDNVDECEIRGDQKNVLAVREKILEKIQSSGEGDSYTRENREQLPKPSTLTLDDFVVPNRRKNF